MSLNCYAMDGKTNSAEDKPDWNSIDFVRLYIKHQTRTDENIEIMDPDTIMVLHTNVKFPIFLDNGNVYNKAELLDKYPFISVMGKNPEDIFMQQSITYFEEINDRGEVIPERCEHIVHDKGANVSSVKDQIYIMKHGKGMSRKPTNTVDTCIYIAGDKWRDFIFLNQFRSSIHSFKDVKLIANSPIGNTMLLEGPSEEQHKKLNEENEVNHKSIPDQKEPITMASDKKGFLSNDKEDLFTGNKPQKEQIPISPHVNQLTFIIYPTKLEYYKIYSNAKIDEINDVKAGDAGIDLPLCTEMNVPSFMTTDGAGVLVNLGIKSCLIDEHGVYHPYFLMPRSSIYKTPLQLANSVGLIDAGYRGDVCAAVRNFSSKEYKREAGVALFQLVPKSDAVFKYIIVNEQSFLYPLLSASTLRGSGGFGSTGLKGNT